jgi:hypothetical protein
VNFKEGDFEKGQIRKTANVDQVSTLQSATPNQKGVNARGQAQPVVQPVMQPVQPAIQPLVLPETGSSTEYFSQHCQASAGSSVQFDHQALCKQTREWKFFGPGTAYCEKGSKHYYSGSTKADRSTHMSSTVDGWRQEPPEADGSMRVWWHLRRRLLLFLDKAIHCSTWEDEGQKCTINHSTISTAISIAISA